LKAIATKQDLTQPWWMVADEGTLTWLHLDKLQPCLLPLD